jgi:hypothetical protein
MQYISQELINFIRAILFGVVVGYAFFYFFLYFKAIIEDILGGVKLNIDTWWYVTITISMVMGMIGALLLM